MMPLLIFVLCCIVALMITDPANEKWWKQQKQRKNGGKLDISISTHEMDSWIFLGLQHLQFLWPSNIFLLLLSILCHNIKRFCNLWHLWEWIYESKLVMWRSSRPEIFCSKCALKNLANFAFTEKHQCQSLLLNKVISL